MPLTHPEVPASTARVELEGVSEGELLELASVRRRRRRLAEVDELVLAAQWAVVQGTARDRRDPMVTPGGAGTPELREFAVAELGMALESHALTARALIADALDLVHRLPLVWVRVRAGECEPWVARRVAVLSRALTSGQVVVVDRAVARVIGGHAPSTVLQVAAAKVMEAAPEELRVERERARRERYVRLSRADEFGFRHLIAKVSAGDAAWIDAMVDRVADILALGHGHDHNRDMLRSEALGWLARPADLLRLLLEHAEPEAEHAEPEAEQGDAGEPCERRVWAPPHLAGTVERLAGLSTRQLAAMRGRCVLFVHVTDEALRCRSGVARVEGLGPVSVGDLAEVLGHADVRVVPVLDLAARRRVDAYEHPEVLKDQAWLLAGGDVFPFSPRSATRDGVDFDHAVPYRPHGPPGQTGSHNSGPLRRRHHRWKTRGGYRCRQVGPGRYFWSTPHGLGFLVDPGGTHRLTPEEVEVMDAAPDGVEVYFAGLDLGDDYPVPIA